MRTCFVFFCVLFKISPQKYEPWLKHNLGKRLKCTWTFWPYEKTCWILLERLPRKSRSKMKQKFNRGLAHNWGKAMKRTETLVVLHKCSFQPTTKYQLCCAFTKYSCCQITEVFTEGLSPEEVTSFTFQTLQVMHTLPKQLKSGEPKMYKRTLSNRNCSPSIQTFRICV